MAASSSQVRHKPSKPNLYARRKNPTSQVSTSERIELSDIGGSIVFLSLEDREVAFSSIYFIISAKGIGVIDRSRVETIRCWSGRAFISGRWLVSSKVVRTFYRRFVNNEKIAMGLTDLIRMFVLDDMVGQSFKALEAVFLTGLSLCIFDLIL
jgi:hypothetical protein